MRQYIGARYTTKIYQNSQDPGSCEWESGVIYEPLTIVSYQNSSYLSRTEVPANAGNPATAAQYWAQTGFYNGQIAQLQSDVADIYSKIGKRDRLNADQKVIYIGDSWSVQGLALGIKNKIGFTEFHDNQYGGSGFVATGDPPATNKRFIDLYNETASGMTADQLADIDVVIVCGGMNDNNYLSSIESAVKTFIDRVKETAVNADIYIIACNNALHGPWSRFSYVYEMMRANMYKGAMIGDATRSALITDYNNNGHLSSYTNVANAVINTINGLTAPDIYTYKTVNVSFIDLSVTNKQLTFYQHGKEMYAYFEGLYFNGSFTYTGTFEIEGTLSDTLVPFIDSEDVYVPLNIQYSGESGYTALMGVIKFLSTGNIRFTIYGKTNGTVQQLYIPNINIPLKW